MCNVTSNVQTARKCRTLRSRAYIAIQQNTAAHHTASSEYSYHCGRRPICSFTWHWAAKACDYTTDAVLWSHRCGIFIQCYLRDSVLPCTAEAGGSRLAELDVWRRDKPAVTGGISHVRPAVALVSFHHSQLFSFQHRQRTVRRRYRHNGPRLNYRLANWDGYLIELKFNVGLETTEVISETLFPTNPSFTLYLFMALNSL